jgi:WD40 repeat protein
VQLVDAASGVPLRAQPPRPVSGFGKALLAFSAADDSLAVTTGDGVVIWDVHRGAVVRSLNGAGGNVGQNGESIAYAGTPTTGRIAVSGIPPVGVTGWNLAVPGAAPAWRRNAPPTFELVDLWIDAGGRDVVETTGDRFDVLDPATGIARMSVPGAFDHVVPTGDGSKLIAVSGTTISVYDAATGRRLSRATTADAGAVTSITTTPDGDLAAYAIENGTVQLIDTRNGDVVAAPFGLPSGALGPVAEFSSGGDALIGVGTSITR